MDKSVVVIIRGFDHAYPAAAKPDGSPNDQRIQGTRDTALAGLIHSQCLCIPLRFIALTESKLFNALWMTIKTCKYLCLFRSPADKLFEQQPLVAMFAAKTGLA